MKSSDRHFWLAVIALLMVVFVLWRQLTTFPRSHESRIERTCADIRGGLKTTLKMFKDDCGRYPTQAEGLKILVKPPAEGSLKGWRGPYFDPPEVPKDAWGHEYVYRFPAVHSTNGYDLYSKGPDGVSDSADDIGNWYEIPVPTRR